MGQRVDRIEMSTNEWDGAVLAGFADLLEKHAPESISEAERELFIDGVVAVALAKTGGRDFEVTPR